MKSYIFRTSRTIYVCEHCGVEDGNKEYMREHEKTCSNNPPPDMEASNDK